jgi:hypothetical protein
MSLKPNVPTGALFSSMSLEKRLADIILKCFGSRHRRGITVIILISLLNVLVNSVLPFVINAPSFVAFVFLAPMQILLPTVMLVMAFCMRLRLSNSSLYRSVALVRSNCGDS